MEADLYQEMSIEELKAYLHSFQKQKVLGRLKREFKKYTNYKNLEDWNKAVRLCESFTILGWSDLTPVEAQKTKYFNGNPYTGFYDKGGKEHYQGAIWSNRKDGYTLEPDRVFHFPTTGKAKKIRKVDLAIRKGKFASQRNWIGKNPVRPFIFLRNAFPELEFIQQKIASLSDFLNADLDSSAYGEKLNYLSISMKISSPFTTYEIVSEKAEKSSEFDKVKTPKFKFNRFTKKDGVYSIDYYIPQQFGADEKETQVENLKTDLMTIVNLASQKLKKKCEGYDFEMLQEDLKRALQKWK